MNQEIVEKWKNNRIPNEFLTDEEYAELQYFGIENLVWAGCRDSEWLPVSRMARESAMSSRLRPDYQLPKEKKEVRKEIIIKNGVLGCLHSFSKTREFDTPMCCLSDTTCDPDFVRFESEGCQLILTDVASAIREGNKVYAVFIE